MAQIARAQFEVENSIRSLPAEDEVFAFDAAEQKRLVQAAPWRQDARFFKRARISATALVKMATHARSGGALEVMGLMQGRVTAGGDIIVLDSFALPVEGTETRVNAGAEAYEYMIQYGETSKQIRRPENVVGWYHSHPGYGCWLSGIDVGTQKQNQTFQDPFLAVVIDPNRTVSAGRVEIGAFRTYPEGYAAQQGAGDDDDGAAAGVGGGGGAKSSFGSVPLNKVEDFGVHANEYYPLEVQHFKSSLDAKLLDALWGKYWIATLAQNALATNRAYTADRLEDLDAKLKQLARKTQVGLPGYPGLATALGAHGRAPPLARRDRSKGKSAAAMAVAQAGPDAMDIDDGSATAGNAASAKRQPTELDQLSRDLDTVVSEQRLGLLTQEAKAMLFQLPPAQATPAAAATS